MGISLRSLSVQLRAGNGTQFTVISACTYA